MIETSAKIAFLKKIHLFHGLEDDELATIAEEIDEASYAAGDVVFEQDSKSENFYLIYSGSVRIVRKQAGKEIQLALLVQHDYFGEMGLVARRRRSGTVTALTDGTLLVLTRKDFENLFKQTPKLRLNFEVSIRSRQLARQLKFKWLRGDEVIYFLARKHSVVLYEKLVLPILSILAPIGLFLGWIYVLQIFLVGFAALASLLAVIFWIGWTVVDWGNDYYIVTNHRVIWLEKVIGIYDSRQESPLSTILGVDVETDQLGRILDYGNVVMRTYVGRIVFTNVSHPNQAAYMIEEYWYRTKEHATNLEKEAMKNAIRKRLGLPMPKQERGFGEPAPVVKKEAPPPKLNAGLTALLKFLGTNTLKLRYEQGQHVIYRKHWVVLIIEAWIPFLGTLGIFLLFIARLVQLAFLPDAAFVSFQNGVVVDAWAGAFLIAFFPFAGWFAYRVMDWSNDKFEVTDEQIIDIDRKPFGTESRNAAQLENILSTRYERNGPLGYVFNFGTVYITVGGSKLAFEDVMDPATVQSDIDRRRMERSVKQTEAKIAGERDRMAEWLATYHKAADQFKDEEKRNPKK
jgi:hypothetical protein